MVKNPFLFICFLFLLCFPTPIMAQEVVLGYLGGKEIVIYTPDYNLILFEELNVGDTIPAGSVIETGIRSSCELHLLPGETVIKLDAMTIFKIETLNDYGQRGSHTFKLIGGTFRAITVQKTGLETYIFRTGASTCTATNADFCMTVTSGKEESVFVLKGECFFSNSSGDIVTVKEGQMADRYAPQFKADSISDRYKFLADRLVLMAPFLEKLDSGDMNEPLLPSVREDTSSAGYEEKTAAPTPLPVSEKEEEPTPLPFDESEKTTGNKKADKNSKENIASPEISSGKRFYENVSYSVRVAPAGREELLIDEVTGDTLIVTLVEPEKAKEYTLFEIYNIYEKSEHIGEQQVYSGFIDSVYLSRIEEEKLIFSYTWEGASKNIKKGFIIYPTGQVYSLEGDVIEPEPETEQAEEEETALSGIPEADEKKRTSPTGSPPLFNIGMGLSVSMGFFDTSSWGEFSGITAVWLTILTMRGTYFIDAILNFLPFMGFGVEAGCGFMTIEFEDYDIQALFLDVPVRGFLRLGGIDTFIQLYGGYYFCVIGSELDGLDMGAKISVGGFFIEGSYIVTDMNDFFGPTSYFRACIGGSFNGILGK